MQNDCGLEIAESPALRGFEAGPRALATAALYLVLKSNGLRHSKNPPVKFGFSPKTVSANIVKKLPAQRCSKPHFIAFFSLSHKWPTFAFTDESGYTHSAFGEKSHTRAHTAKQVAFWVGVVSLPSERFTRFGNPAWPGVRTAYFAAFGAWPRVLPKNAESLRNSDALMRVAVPRRRGPAGPRCSVCNLVMLLFFYSVRSTF